MGGRACRRSRRLRQEEGHTDGRDRQQQEEDLVLRKRAVVGESGVESWAGVRDGGLRRLGSERGWTVATRISMSESRSARGGKSGATHVTESGTRASRGARRWRWGVGTFQWALLKLVLISTFLRG